MLTVVDFTLLVERITYKPGYRLRLERFAKSEDRYFIQVVANLPDAVSGMTKPQHGGKWSLSPHMTKSELIARAFGAFKAFEEHEARDWFKYNGVRVMSPHHDLEQISKLVKSGLLGEDGRDG